MFLTNTTQIGMRMERYKLVANKVLSVTIAAYNASKTLRQALNSFLADDVAPYVDVMIVNDGFEDDAARIAREYTTRLPDTFRLISIENGSWGSILNKGIAAAAGKYYMRLDGDDYLSTENLADFLSFLQTTDADLIHTPFIQFEDGSGGIINEQGGYSASYAHFPLNQTLCLDEFEDYIPAIHNITVKTETLRERSITIMEHCYYADEEFALKVYNCCETVCFYQKPIYYDRVIRSGQNVRVAGARKHYKDHIRMLKSMLEYTDKNLASAHKKKNIDKKLLEECAFQYIIFFALKGSRKEKEELKQFDYFLKDEYPAIYHKIDGRQIKILRNTGFNGYKLLAWQKMQKDRRLKRNFFER